MIVMALLAAGLVALVLGLTGSGVGLAVVGLVWIVVAALGRRHARRLLAIDASAVTVEMMLRGTAVLLTGGVLALVVGLTQWQIVDADVRWLPVLGGVVLTAFALLTAALFLLGSGLEAVVGEPPTVPAVLTIVTATETGMLVNDRPRIEFVLDVAPEGQPSYRVTKKATVPFTALGSIRPGDGFKAMVEGPGDPEKMVIDWTATVPGR